MKKGLIICWWSGGVTSAVACNIAIDLYGLDNCKLIMIDTGNEDEDTYRFKSDCESWYGKEIETITGLGGKFKSIKDVWLHFKSLNVANGAICSSELKRSVRLDWQKNNDYKHQVFGFDIDETKRAKSMTLNYPQAKPIYPLLNFAYSKNMCIDILSENKIEIPRTYKYGFNNNNCFKTGCVQGGIGYWQKIKREFPLKFEAMAKVEHDLTNLKGKPVTMLKDQSKEAKKTDNQLVFLKPNKNYPHMKDISHMKGREPQPLFECNGFGCAVNDLHKKNTTASEINYHS